MKTIMLLFLTFVLASTAPMESTQSATRPQQQQTNLLKEIMRDVKRKLPENLKNKYVPHVFDKHSCMPADFCKAEKILKDIKLEDFGLDSRTWKLTRRLKIYKGKTECTVTESGTEYTLGDLLEAIHICVQRINSRSHADA